MAAFKIFFVVFPLLFAQSNCFTADFIHRDSPLSPFYNPSKSRFETLRDAFRRSQTRAAYFSKRAAAGFGSVKIATDLEIVPGEYVMRFSIGTPRVERFAIADTGSDLTWTQCEPCVDCFRQNFPLFDPGKSSSYRPLECFSPLCLFSCAGDSVCQYKYGYADGSTTAGEIAAETFAFGNVTFRNIVFGCGHENGGTFGSATTGIVGLARGALSIMTQLDEHIGGMFAYCLPSPYTNPNVTTHITFGAEAIISDLNDVVTTHLIRKNDSSSFYWLTLEDISVGNTTVMSQQSAWGPAPPSPLESGNIILDSGTTLTYLPTDLYEPLEMKLRSVIKNAPVSDPGGFFPLCFESTGGDFEAPRIVAHFTNGADVELSPKGTFELVKEGVVCLTLVPATTVGPIFGNLSQMDYVVAYDLVGETVTFKPADCSKF